MARRYYRSEPRAGYWTQEVPAGGPEGIKLGDYVVKHYRKAGKWQSFNWITGTSYTGLSKGVTINLAKITEAELDSLRNLIIAAIDAEKSRRVASASFVPEPSVPTARAVCALTSMAASDPSRFKAIQEAAMQRVGD